MLQWASSKTRACVRAIQARALNSSLSSMATEQAVGDPQKHGCADGQYRRQVQDGGSRRRWPAAAVRGPAALRRGAAGNTRAPGANGGLLVLGPAGHGHRASGRPALAPPAGWLRARAARATRRPAGQVLNSRKSVGIPPREVS